MLRQVERGEGSMTRKEKMMLPAGMGCLFAGFILKRVAGDSYPMIGLQILLFGVSIFFNIRHMLKLRAERSAKGGDE